MVLERPLTDVTQRRDLGDAQIPQRCLWGRRADRFEVCVEFSLRCGTDLDAVGGDFQAYVLADQRCDVLVLGGPGEVGVRRVVLPGDEVDVGQRSLRCLRQDVSEVGNLVGDGLEDHDVASGQSPGRVEQLETTGALAGV